MKLNRQLQFVLACGVSCGIMGCKSPMTWLSRPAHGASTAPDVQYNGVTGFSSTVKQNTGATVVSGAKPEGTMAKAWSSTTGAVTSLLGTSPKSKDATSLSSKPGKLDADIYLRAAHFAEQGGNLPDAEAKYQQALKVEPKNVSAIVGLARLYDQQGNSQQAIATYQQAIKLHPKNAVVYNDFGLCYGRRRELAPAQQMLQKAVELEPGKANYRNNLATVLVDMGRPADAYQHLHSVQGEGVAHYNLACLLHSRGQNDQAAGHLQQAIAKDQTLTPARELLAQLEGQPQENMRMASAITPSRERREERRDQRDDARARGRQGNPQMQLEQSDLQPPTINYGPAAPPAHEGIYRSYEDAAPAPQQYPARRTSHVAEAAAEKTPGNSPATIRITDDEE
ncbi:MAG: tetratricopeptide repeat protein [Pirellulaceae bacterium]|nr:tetratricopeptide repeat protein [Pirellulaceae bacterium]